VAHDDGEPGNGYHPTGLWRPGDLIVDKHILEVGQDELNDARLLVGLYVWPTIEQLEARGPDDTPLGTQLSLPISGNPSP
jgi:hypothetical protein